MCWGVRGGGSARHYITGLWDWCFLCVSSSSLLVLMLCAAVLRKMKAAKKGKKNFISQARSEGARWLAVFSGQAKQRLKLADMF